MRPDFPDMTSQKSGFEQAVFLIILFVGISGDAYSQEPPSEEVLQQLAPTGQLRFAFPYNNASIVRQEPDTGEWAGPGVTLARLLASSLGVPLVPVPIGSPVEMFDSVGRDVWDVTLIAVADREGLIFTRPVQQVDQTFLVMPGVTVDSVSDADRPGIRIMLRRSSIYDYVLTPLIDHAEIVRVDGSEQVLAALMAGEADLYASTRTNLLATSEQIADSRVLADRFGVTKAALALWERHTAARDYADRFVAESLRSGLIAELIATGGVPSISAPTLTGEVGPGIEPEP